ncbi:uncharacterized protein CLUP02_10365 [Colletotrichum lupini]|uniref:Uncharacterized protein n=1 Tax=Colletotrichum lupini TaxID=145971 RepID=A0A9Q8SWH2_9PEZI|nr:uncharacterized protein CLUP02_10365 [Colletotrichum lupini]UQC84869.1 hypothetical protein CLUP02_10365 [Colletotrichum lupini]
MSENEGVVPEEVPIWRTALQTPQTYLSRGRPLVARQALPPYEIAHEDSSIRVYLLCTMPWCSRHLEHAQSRTCTVLPPHCTPPLGYKRKPMRTHCSTGQLFLCNSENLMSSLGRNVHRPADVFCRQVADLESPRGPEQAIKSMPIVSRDTTPAHETSLFAKNIAWQWRWESKMPGSTLFQQLEMTTCLISKPHNTIKQNISTAKSTNILVLHHQHIKHTQTSINQPNQTLKTLKQPTNLPLSQTSTSNLLQRTIHQTTTITQTTDTINQTDAMAPTWPVTRPKPPHPPPDPAPKPLPPSK